MKPNKLVLINQEYFNDYGFDNHFTILSLVEKEIANFKEGEAEEVLAVSYDDEGFALFDFVRYEPQKSMFEHNCYVYEFTGSVK